MATEQRRVIWRHPKGIYETVEVSGTGVFGVPYCYRETVYTQDRDARGVAHKEIQPAPPNGGRPAGGPRIPLTDKPANKKSSPQADLTKENIAGSGRRKAQHQKAAANAPTGKA